MARAKKGWHPADIKAAIQKTGITLKDLALKNGLSESLCRMAIIYRCAPSGERVIAKHLNVAPYDIWPDRYNPDGTRSIGRDLSTAATTGDSQKSAVA